MSVHEIKVKIHKREDVEKRRDHVRSVEINMMLELMRRYPEKAKECAVDLFKFPLTNRAA